MKGRRKYSGASGAGKRRRDNLISLIALFKFLKVALLVLFGIGALKLVQRDSTPWLGQWVLSFTTAPTVRRTIEQILARIGEMDPHRLAALGVGAFAYAGLFMLEGIGLWKEKRWAEYLTVIATASFVPIEIYELARRVTPTRALALVFNVAIIFYLIHRLRRRGRDD